MSLSYTAIINQLASSMSAAAERMTEQSIRIAECEARHEMLKLKAKGWAESLRGEGYERFAEEVEEAFR